MRRQTYCTGTFLTIRWKHNRSSILADKKLEERNNSKTTQAVLCRLCRLKTEAKDGEVSQPPIHPTQTVKTQHKPKGDGTAIYPRLAISKKNQKNQLPLLTGWPRSSSTKKIPLLLAPSPPSLPPPSKRRG